MSNLLKPTVALSLIASLMTSASVWAGEKVDESKQANAKGDVVIDVESGKVEIRTWDKNEVHVKGELDDDAEGYKFEVDGDRVFFKVEMPDRRWGSYDSDDGSKLKFFIPKGSELKFEGVNVDVNASGVEGGSRINTVNGDVMAKDLSARVKLETVNGEIKGTNLSGKIYLNTVNGEVEDKDSKGEVTIETVNGDISSSTQASEVYMSNVNGDMDIVTSGNAEEVEISTVNGDLDIELSMAKKGKFSFSSVGGDADIVFSGEVSADFDIETHAGGDITNRLSKHKAKEAKYGPSESLRFKLGGGDADIEIDTVNGDVVLKKK